MGVILRKLAELVGGELIGNADMVIDSAAPIEKATTGQITFVANNKYKKFLETTTASAVVVSLDTAPGNIPVIRHANPYYAFALIIDALYPDEDLTPDIDPTAVIDPTSKIDSNSSIGALAFIGHDCQVGANCQIMPKVFIGDKVTIGRNCKIYPQVSILNGTKIGDHVIIHSGTVVGSDGFGYARHELGIKKIKQVGWVEIGDCAEIGANVTIDRGALGPTIIGKHVKIDNLVQIAHNVEIGDYSIIVSQAGISGSTKLGRGVILAGQSGLIGHLNIGDNVTIAAQSGVADDIPSGKIYLGSPAREHLQAKRIEACLSKLPELFRRVKRLEED